MGIRKGDQVVVISGKDKGKKGKVLSVEDDRVIVSGVNVGIKHKKARTAAQKSERKKEEHSVDISNVMILCKCGKATRIAHKIDGNGKSVRVCVKCGEVLDKKFVKVKEKAKEAEAEAPKEEAADAAKKPLVRREVKSKAESTIKGSQVAAKSHTSHRQIGGA
jgi:large subunit ribosomal protein L24